jgi:altronate dehydratase large subunit
VSGICRSRSKGPGVESTFQGFPRRRGPAGVRNHVLVLPSVVCSASVAEQIAARVPGAGAAPHQHGCSQIGEDREQTFRALAGTGSNPNVWSVLVVGLGCEAISSAELAQAIADRGTRVQRLDIQDEGGTTKAIARGCELAAEMVRRAGAEVRRPVPLSELTLGTECGGSDAWSGVTANPVIGQAADRLVEAGGTVILSETTELIGAEHVLERRARDAEVAAGIRRIVDETEQRVIAYGADIRGGNPTPGNLAGGITTLEEKSLGCVHKGGTTDVQEVIGYAERASRGGLVVMDTPGQDVESVTGMIAGGAQVIVFSTGRGSPVGSVVAPVVKVSSNTQLYEKMPEDMDLNAGVVITEARTVQEVGGLLFEHVVRVASGELTCAERLGHAEFALTRIGPTV